MVSETEIPTSKSSSRQAIFLCIGQAGCQIGSSLWALLNEEHGVLPDGTGITYGNDFYPHINFYKDSIFYKDDEFHRTFSYIESNKTEKFIPRTMFIDLEPMVIDEIKTGSYRTFFNEELNFFQFSKMGDGSSIFPRAYNAIGRHIITNVMNSVRHLVERTDQLSVFNIARSNGGATGSGVGSLVLENIQDSYPKIILSETNIFNFGSGDSPTLEPYNNLFGIETSCSCSNITFFYNNKALKRLCYKRLNIKHPFYINLNQIMSYSVSGIYSTERFPGYGNCNIDSILTNLIPYPRIQFPISTLAPITRKEVIKYEKYSIPSDLTDKIVSNDYTMFDVDLNSGNYISCCMIYRGLVSPGNIAQNHQILLKDKVRLLEWSPSGIKSGHSPLGLIDLPNSDFGVSSLSMMMLANHTNINNTFAEETLSVHIMLKKKAFLHWYYEYGMEEEDFNNALENFVLLTLDYKEIEKYRENNLNDGKNINDTKRNKRPIKPKRTDMLYSRPTKPKPKSIAATKAEMLYKQPKEDEETVNTNEQKLKEEDNVIPGIKYPESNDMEEKDNEKDNDIDNEKDNESKSLNFDGIYNDDTSAVSSQLEIPKLEEKKKLSSKGPDKTNIPVGNIEIERGSMKNSICKRMENYMAAQASMNTQQMANRKPSIGSKETFANMTLLKTYEESYLENITPRQSIRNTSYLDKKFKASEVEDFLALENAEILVSSKAEKFSKRTRNIHSSQREDKKYYSRKKSTQSPCIISLFKNYEESFVRAVVPRISLASLNYSFRSLERANSETANIFVPETRHKT